MKRATMEIQLVVMDAITYAKLSLAGNVLHLANLGKKKSGLILLATKRVVITCWIQQLLSMNNAMMET